ncbi:MAG TPA: efflux RND transporter periplasmic adaptor subunit [Deltaproteobacteria bacterium]|jgi:HlyD family secretion protein|nr:efflux RND transporter periplasmic adaptor subunit [Pseudomonadota bacterium]HNR50973.1 efflux RND transporter periplasmic adaptor subunit [Deltaproteobacteria bacterium]HRR69913.1 efflux RND transporter periplasmic adaptor subunit [Desulfomonilia bacterium]HOD70071.1 efflux RND transporter periplasmic adaptor subunit [Deltaproteobacteria bacterium]HPA84494.1 efflux RND transporter periplasmic adaptor subunit [Deltaproteobacteria bacterium]
MMKEDTQTETDTAGVLGSGPGGWKTMGRRLGWGSLVLAVVLAVFIWGFYGDGEAVTYRVQKAQRGDLTITVSATGNLHPTNQVDVGSERSGIVRSVNVDYNDQVKVGQVLACLDTSLLEAEIRKSSAALESAEAKIALAKATMREAEVEFSRMKQAHDLTGGKVPSARELDAAEAALARARAEEAAARAQASQARATLEANRTDLSKALILSPINGVVLSRSVEPGQTVAASLQAPVLFTLAEDLALMELHVDLDEADVSKVEPGQKAVFSVDAYPGRSFPAEIIQVRYSAKSEGGVVTYETVLRVDNSELLLRPGMTATADITVNRVENAVLVPNSALRFTPRTAVEEGAEKGSMLSKLMPRPPRRSGRGPQKAVVDASGAAEQKIWILENGSPVSVTVTAGATDGIMTEIIRGIEPGMEVIVGTVIGKK